ncbi:MAG TPA: cytochrome d ubiquinol oxidase subunit II [Solirubrobacteraceae bacterium]|jgi:cytochrome d ubiquinol oxidase subunit II|nr:cytochrome d ubiquinol oxidase subunit II [Solirubrobacteraceae bacterium]
MHFYDLPLVFAGIGLVLYTVLAGADFGAGFWQLLPGRGESGRRIRDHAHHAMAPVWEANHVWLIFVITVIWTAYPIVFASVASTLTIPFLIAALGIVLRGTAYATRSGSASLRETAAIDTVLAASSVLAPFALGTMVGAIASRRVPVGNAAGALWGSWLNPTSLLIGVLAVATSAYLAAVYLAADARRLGHRDLAAAFRTRALVSGISAGAVALVGIAVIHGDAHNLYERLLHTDAVAGLVVSVLAGAATLVLVRGSRFDAARVTAALAVSAMIAGWAVAQNPILLPGLTIAQAAAPHDAIVCLVVAIVAGGVILFPSLGLLFRLVLAGQLDHPSPPPPPRTARELLSASRAGLLGRLCGGSFLVGFACLTLADARWAHAVGVIALLGFAVSGFLALVADELSPSGPPA